METSCPYPLLPVGWDVYTMAGAGASTLDPQDDLGKGTHTQQINELTGVPEPATVEHSTTPLDF